MSSKIKDYEVHPAAKLFPMMDAAELKELAVDIEENGQQSAAILFENKLLDGRNRVAACKMVRIEPRYIRLDACPSPTAFVIGVNLHRRHLTASQKAAIATESLPLFALEAKERERARKTKSETTSPKLDESTKGRSDQKAAKAVGVSRSYVADAKAIKEASPETFEKVKSGEMSIPEAKKKIADEEDRSDAKCLLESKKEESVPASEVLPKPNIHKLAKSFVSKTLSAFLRDYSTEDQALLRAAIKNLL